MLCTAARMPDSRKVLTSRLLDSSTRHELVEPIDKLHYMQSQSYPATHNEIIGSSITILLHAHMS